MDKRNKGQIDFGQSVKQYSQNHNVGNHMIHTLEFIRFCTQPYINTVRGVIRTNIQMMIAMGGQVWKCIIDEMNGQINEKNNEIVNHKWVILISS